MRSICFVAIGALSLATFAGCGSGIASKQAATPVALEVLCQGKPPIDAQVTLHPVNEVGAGTMPARPRGIVGPDGLAPLTSYVTNDGAPEGEYVVTVIWRPAPANANEDDKPGPDRLNGRFADPAKSPLRAVVKRDSKDPIRVTIP